MPEPERIYFDTCVFIEILQQNVPKRFDASDALRHKAAQGSAIIVTSAVSFTEVNKLPESKIPLPEEQSKLILAFFENRYIAVRPVTREIAEKAHELTRTHGLTNLDAIHVATALIAKVPVLYTYDGPKQKRKGLLRYDGQIGIPPLRIENPPDPLAGTLLSESELAKREAEKAGGDGKVDGPLTLHPLTPEQAIAKAFGAPPPKGTHKPKASKQARKK